MKQILPDGSVVERAGHESISGTSLQGGVDTGYATLVHLFGEPSDGDGYKVDAEWTISTPDGVATIYNYKDGPNYMGTGATPVEAIRDWHIGGHDTHVVKWISLAIAEANPSNNLRLQRSVALSISYDEQYTQDVLRILDLLSAVADTSRREPKISIRLEVQREPVVAY
jgi:hypothetical protein